MGPEGESEWWSPRGCRCQGFSGIAAPRFVCHRQCQAGRHELLAFNINAILDSHFVWQAKAILVSFMRFFFLCSHLSTRFIRAGPAPMGTGTGSTLCAQHGQLGTGREADRLVGSQHRPTAGIVHPVLVYTSRTQSCSRSRGAGAPQSPQGQHSPPGQILAAPHCRSPHCLCCSHTEEFVVGAVLPNSGIN